MPDQWELLSQLSLKPLERITPPELLEAFYFVYFNPGMLTVMNRPSFSRPGIIEFLNLNILYKQLQSLTFFKDDRGWLASAILLLLSHQPHAKICYRPLEPSLATHYLSTIEYFAKQPNLAFSQVMTVLSTLLLVLNNYEQQNQAVLAGFAFIHRAANIYHYLPAKAILANLYRTGKVLGASREDAWKLLTTVANENYWMVQRVLSQLYLQERSNNPANLDKLLTALSRAASAGDSVAQYNLGWFWGEKKNFTACTHWYSRAAWQGSSSAQFAYGVCHLKGVGVQRNIDRAAHWFRLAALQDHEKAKNVLDKLNSDKQENTVAAEGKLPLPLRPVPAQIIVNNFFFVSLNTFTSAVAAHPKTKTVSSQFDDKLITQLKKKFNDFKVPEAPQKRKKLEVKEKESAEDGSNKDAEANDFKIAKSIGK